MAKYPMITGACPVADDLDANMQGSMCNLCNKDVHDLTGMDVDEQRDFLSKQTGEVCVSYKIPETRSVEQLQMASGKHVVRDGAGQMRTCPGIIGGYCSPDEIEFKDETQIDFDSVPVVPIEARN